MIFENIDQLINNISENFADDIFLESKKRLRIDRYSFLQINKLSGKVTSFLKSSGLEKGDRVLIWAPNSLEWIVCFFGAIRGGYVAVPVDFRTTFETANKFIEQTKPKIIFISKIGPSVPKLKNTDVFILEELLDTIQDFEDISNNKVGLDDLAEIIFTSGSTGIPKGVELTHGNLISSVTSLRKSFPANRNLKMLSILPLSHIFEQVAGLLLPFIVGAKVVYLTRINSITIIKGMRRHKITSILVVPQILHLMLLTLERKIEKDNRVQLFKILLGVSRFMPFEIRKIIFSKIHSDFGGKLEFFACGGAPLESDIGNAWEAMGFKVYEGYGSTETTALSTMNLAGGDMIEYVGKAVSGVDIKIAPDGEVMIKGPSIFKGYWKNKYKTHEAFEGKWYKTGDIGKLTKNGLLYLVGRQKFRIVLPDGKKVYPEDIEKKLNKNQKVKDSCVLGIKADGGTYIHAAILTDYPEEINDLITDVNKELESSQQIFHFSVWEGVDFPRLRTLKIDRAAVEKSVTSQNSKSVKKQETIEEKQKLDEITKLIAQLAEIPAHSIKDDTNLAIDLKFDSLKRVELISALEEELGISIDESLINNKTTVGQIKTLSNIEHIVSERIRSTWPRKSVATWIRTAIQDTIVFPVHSIFAPINCTGLDNFKNISEPAIFFINHIGPHDMLIPLRLLSKERRRKMAIAADSNGWDRYGVGFFLEFLADAYPFVKAGAGIKESLEFTGELLDSGFNLLIAPEGNFSPDGSLQPFRNGTGLLGVEFGVDMIPIKISTTYREIFPDLNGKIGELIPRKRRLIDVKIGKPIRFDENVDYDLATRKMEEAMKVL